jgi:hypothetical protein
MGGYRRVALSRTGSPEAHKGVQATMASYNSSLLGGDVVCGWKNIHLVHTTNDRNHKW